MSETTSFVGGAAVAALAAFVLMRGGVNANNSPVAPPAAPPSATSAPNVTTTPTAVVPAQTLYAYEQQNQAQKQALQQLQAIVDRQKVESDKLKEYIQRQHLELEMLKAKAANPSASPQGSSALAAGASDQQPNPLFLGIAWALGGVMLSFGGGLLLIMMFAWFVRQQQRNARSQEYYQSRPVYRLPPATGHYVQPPIRVVPRRYREIEEEL
jgi:hypothetical protein